MCDVFIVSSIYVCIMYLVSVASSWRTIYIHVCLRLSRLLQNAYSTSLVCLFVFFVVVVVVVNVVAYVVVVAVVVVGRWPAVGHTVVVFLASFDRSQARKNKNEARTGCLAACIPCKVAWGR